LIRLKDALATLIAVAVQRFAIFTDDHRFTLRVVFLIELIRSLELIRSGGHAR
jgi:hypothetical protein